MPYDGAMSVGDVIRRRLRERGAGPALEAGGTVLSFRELEERARSWGQFLEELDVGRGEVVAFALESGVDLVSIHLGNLLYGRVSLPLNPRMTVGEFADRLGHARPALVVCGRDAEAALGKAREGLGQKPHLLEERFIRSAFSSGRRSPQVNPPPLDDTEAAMLVYTSGTTGAAKAAVLTQGNLEAAARALENAWELCAEDHLLLALPLFHVHGLGVGIHGMFTTGHRVTLRPRFDPAEVAELVSDEARKINLFYGVPTFYHRLLEAPLEKTSWKHMRLCVSGSAPLSLAMRRRFEETFQTSILERYGMSETLMNLSQPLRGRRHGGFVGQPLPGVEIRVVDDHGLDVEAGREGELLIRGPHVTPGYWGDAEATARAFTSDGWFRTGDLGRFDPEKEAWQITGRLKELIITGGENVNPVEVESILKQHPAVKEAGVAGIQDEEWGERLTAFVVTRNEDLSPDELIAFCRERLSGYKVPRTCILTETLPRNALGKLERHKLKDLIP